MKGLPYSIPMHFRLDWNGLDQRFENVQVLSLLFFLLSSSASKPLFYMYINKNSKFHS